MKTRGRKTTPKPRRENVARWQFKKGARYPEYLEFCSKPAVSPDNQNPPPSIR